LNKRIIGTILNSRDRGPILGDFKVKFVESRSAALIYVAGDKSIKQRGA
jgi:hypothetical protein